jgi:hypothetical protein
VGRTRIEFYPFLLRDLLHDFIQFGCRSLVVVRVLPSAAQRERVIR